MRQLYSGDETVAPIVPTQQAAPPPPERRYTGLHLLPTFLVLALLAVAWRWPWVGGAALVAAALLFLWRWGGN